MPKGKKPKSIDERLEFLLHSTESLHDSVGLLTDDTRQLTETVRKHEQTQERFRRAMRAALRAWLNENGKE